jgi:hypothetical protein
MVESPAAELFGQELPIPDGLRHGIIETGRLCLFWLFCLAYSCYFILLAGSA